MHGVLAALAIVLSTCATAMSRSPIAVPDGAPPACRQCAVPLRHPSPAMVPFGRCVYDMQFGTTGNTNSLKAAKEAYERCARVGADIVIEQCPDCQGVRGEVLKGFRDFMKETVRAVGTEWDFDDNDDV